MRSYSLLVVDDEPHVIDTIVSLLEAQADLSLDIYYAYSGRQAIKIMKKGKIDLLITDIQMPDMTGIELVDVVNKLWPICKTVFLTAHSDFNYAYEAIRKHVVSYILKSEDDDYIVSEIRKAVSAIEEELNQKQVLRDFKMLSTRKTAPVNRELFFYILEHTGLPAKQLLPLLTILGFQKPLHTLHLVYGIIRHPSPKIKPQVFSTVKDIFNYNMNSYLSHTVCETDENGYMIWIISPKENDSTESSAIQFSGMLGTVQSSCMMTAGIDISFILSAPIKDITDVSIVYKEINNLALLKTNDNEPYIFTFYREQKTNNAMHPVKYDYLFDNTIDFIKDYIDSNLANDVSLMQLSTVTGYNSSYISDLFHKTTGEKLSRYIARKKLLMIDKLLSNQELTIEKVCKAAGFSSRQHFNYFIKKETGLPPKKYRIKVLSNQKGSS